MSTPKLVIFGATGQQGLSILNAIHAHPTLSQQFSLRAITRSASSPTSLSIRNRGIEVLSADIDNPSSLPSAVVNAHTVILITLSIYDADLRSREYTQVKNIATAALAAGVKRIIYSTAVDCSQLWPPGTIPRVVDAFESKAVAEEYLRSLPIQTMFFAPGCFMQNFSTFFAPRKQLDSNSDRSESYILTNVIEKDAKIPLIDIETDTGKYVCRLLLDGKDGDTLYAASGLYSFSDIARIMSRVSGKELRYVQVPEEVFAGFMPPEQGMRTVHMMKWFEEGGYFGPRTEELVRESIRRVGRELTRFEEYAERWLVDF